MRKIWLKGVLTLPFCAVCLTSARGAEPILEGESLSPASPFEFDFQNQTMVATNGAMVTYRDEDGAETVLSANFISFSQTKGDAIADGSVTLRQDKLVWMSDHLEYNFFSRRIQGAQFRVGTTPYYATGINLNVDKSNQVYVASNGYLTADDVASPFLKIRAKKLRLIPGKAIQAHNAVLYMGRIPIMYFPYYSRSLGPHQSYLRLAPGYRSLYGPYILSQYQWRIDEHFGLGMEADYRQKRGLGFGPQVRYDFEHLGQGQVKFYYTHDDKPGIDPQGKPIDPARHRISFDHQALIRTNLTFKVAIHEQADPYMIRDFFESEYRKDVQPKSFVEISQFWRNFGLNVFAQPRVNTFYETVERLPEVKLTGVRQKLGASPFYYDSESSLGYYRHEYADNFTNSFDAFRADTYQQLLFHQTYGGWLNVTPRVGGRFTHYSKTDSRNYTLDEQDRWVFNTGAEFSTKFTRTWKGIKNQFWDVDGLRHIVEPSANYVFVPEPDKRPPDLPQFDSLLNSYRLLPIDYPDFNSIDSIDARNVMRLGLRNALQTKREDEVDSFINWALYTDWRLERQPGQATFSDFYSDLDFKPRKWLILTSETRFDLPHSDLKEANHFLTLQPNHTWSWSIGHRFLQDDPALGSDYTLGNNLIINRVYYRFNENWAARASQHYEARDGKLEEQYYTLYRDLRSWTAALTFRWRDNRVGADDFTVGVTFSLKAFPLYSLDSDRENPSLLLGY